MEKEVWHFSNQEFSNEEDALKAAQEMEKRWNYHRISTIEVVEQKKKKDDEALTAYKEQQYAERGFRFMKDPFFFAHSVFLENEGRIERRDKRNGVNVSGAYACKPA